MARTVDSGHPVSARTFGCAARRVLRFVAVLTLALGIGASTAIFSAVNPILFEPLPYPHAGRVMMIWDFGPDGSRLDVTFGTYRELVERSRSFDAIAVMRAWQPTMTGPAEPERLDGQRVSASYFRVLGVSPALGRDFDSSDDGLNGPKVAILSDGLWRRRFGGDQHDRRAPDHARRQQLYRHRRDAARVRECPGSLGGALVALAVRHVAPAQGREWGHHLRMVGRLRPGVGTDQARRELDTIAHAPVPEFPRPPWASARAGVHRAIRCRTTSRAASSRRCSPSSARSCWCSLIACVNVTNLLLARGAQRRGEFAMRAALGAGRARLIRQLLTESLLLAALGGALGMVVAEFGVRALVALSPPGLPRVSAIGVDGTVFAFGLGITTLIGLVVGLIPALHASRGDLHIGTAAKLTAYRRRSPIDAPYARRRGGRARPRAAGERGIAVAQPAAPVRGRSGVRCLAPAHDAGADVRSPIRRRSTTHRFFAQALEAVRQVPGVTAAAFTSQLPLSGDLDEYGVHFESSPTTIPRRITARFGTR